MDITKLSAWSHQKQSLGYGSATAIEALHKTIGVYSAHPSGPLSLHARVKTFTAEEFRLLDQDKLTYRIPAMRQSAYMLPVANAPVIKAATLAGPEDPEWEKRYSEKGREVPPAYYPEWKAEVLELCKEPLSVKDLKPLISFPREKLKFLLNRLAFEGHILRIGNSGMSSNTIAYVSTMAWTGQQWPYPDPGSSLLWLAEAYFGAFGPARIKDFQWWAGITATKAKQAISESSIEPLSDNYLILSQEKIAYEHFSYQWEEFIDLLPQWDAYTMGYAPDGRQRFVDPDHQDKIYGKLGATLGNGIGTILLNGMAIGAWGSRKKGKKLDIRIAFFNAQSKEIQFQLKERFIGLKDFLQVKEVNVIM